MNLLQFKYHVESVLASGTRAVQAEQFPDLLETLLGSDLHYTIKDEGLKYLAEKAKDVIPKSVLDVIESTESLKGDTEALLAIVANGLSQSLNSIALDVTRRDIHGSDEEDVFAKPMDRLTKGLLGKLHLRGVMNEIGINVPDGDDFKEHWTRELFGEARSLSEFRNMDWKDIAEKVKGIHIEDKSRLEQLFTGKLGPEAGVEHIPIIREQLRSKNVNLGFASELEKKDKKNIADVTKSDIDTFEFEGSENMKKVEKNEMKNYLKAIVANAKKEEEVSTTKKKMMTDEEAFAIGQKIKGGPEVLKGLDGLTDIAPLIAGVSGVAAPQVALEIAATKMLAQEGQNRQKEADKMMQTIQQKSREARNEALKLMEELDVKSTTKEQKEQLEKAIDKIKSKVKESATFDAVGQHFNSQKLWNDLESNALKLPSSAGGVIESYSSNEKLVASVSGGMTLHGISLLLGEYPIESVSTPILKEPSYVEVYGVDQPFNSSVFKCTKEKELSTFHKTAMSGGMSMAESTSSSFSIAAGMKYTKFFAGVSAEGSYGTSSAQELARSKIREEENGTEENVKTKKAFLTEYIKMPMRCVRIPYDSMSLSEDAKREIFKMTTLLEAFRFFRTFGSHLSCGEYTLGGVFFRTIAIESTEKVDSVSMFAVAGSTMSEEVSKGRTVNASGGVSLGVFGLGLQASGGIDGGSVRSNGQTNQCTESDRDGTKTANKSCSYSVTVSSLGPNANTSEEFFTQLNTNTGTWSVIDKGALDHVIPVWDLIRDELFEEEKFKDIQKQLTISEQEMIFMKQQRQILKACRLLKRAWATKTREFLDSPSPPKLPDTIMHTINDFIKVNENIGSMVNCICSLVIPNISKVQDQGLRGNRLSMLKSLQTLVRSAKEVYLDDSFSYDNWFVKDLLKAGQERLDKESKKGMIFPDFDVAPHDDVIGENDATVPIEIRRMHAEAIECAGNLTIDAWEDLCDDFINLARVVKMPYFHAAEDKERTTKVWNLTSDSGCKRTAYLQTSVDTIHIEAMQGKTIYCPDAVSPIDVYAAPPLAYDGKWEWYKILRANRIIKRKLYPRVTYYLVRENNFRDSNTKEVESAEFLTEGAMLQNGWIIIENAYLCDLKMFIKGRPEGIDLHRNSVHLQAFNEETKMEIALRFRQLEENDCDQPPEEIDYKRKVSRGNKYFVHFSNEDPLLQSAPRLIEPRDKIVENKRNKGSLIISHHSMQRLHVWQDGDFPLNAVTKDGCEDFCQDQFWIFHPVEAPKLPGEMYDPDQKVFTINSKKSKERLYAKLKEYGTSQQDFGLVPNEVDIDDSQKWQILEGHLVDNEGSKGKYYYIVNAHSDRFLGILSEGDAPSSKLNCVIAAIAEEACLDTHSMKKFQWIVAPWKILLNQITSTNKLPEEKDKDFMELPEDVKKFVPDKKIILKRSSLPAKTLLDNGGITISNPYPYIYTVRWSGEDRGETLMPNSSVELPNHQKDTSKAEIIIAYELTEVKVEVEPKQKYNLHYGEDDPFRLGLPKVLSPDVITKEKPKPREGYYLIQKDSDGNLLRLGGISRYSFVSCSHRNPKAYIMDQIRETEASSTKNESISVGNCLSCFHSDPNAYIDQIWEIEPLSNKGEFRITTTFRIDKSQNRMYLDCGNERASSFDDSSCIWKIDSKSQERGDGLIWYSIKNKYGYLHAKDGEECCLKQDFDECQWAIIEKSEINSEQTRKGLHHFGDTISFKDMSTLLEDYRSSHKWRIAGINCANSTWDVKSIVFYGPDGNRIDIDANNAMSSGQCGGLGPSSAFSDTIDKFWSGRPNTSGEIYIGMNFETKVKVRSVKVTMHNENIPKKVQLQFLYHDYWVTIAENAGPINRKETIRIEVKQINNAKFPFSQVKLEAPGSNEVPAKDWVVGSLFYPQDGLQLHHDWPNDDLSHGCIRIQTRESDELNKMINSTDGKYKGGSFTMKKPFPLLDFVKTTGNIYFEFIVQEIGETIQGRELFECLCDIKFALTKSSGERPGKEDAIGFSFALENTFDGWDDYEEERYQSSKCFAEVPYDSILIPYHSFVANKCYAIKIEPDWKNSKVAFSMKHYNEVKTVEVILPKTESGEAKFNGINGCCIEGKLVNSNSLGDFNIAIRNMEIDFDLPFWKAMMLEETQAEIAIM